MKLTDLLSQLDIPIAPEGHHHARPGWIQMDCPFCGKDSHKWHLGYSLESNFFNCWRCGPHSLLETLVEITGYSFAKCKRMLKDIETTRIIKKEKPKGKLIIPKGVGPLLTAHKQYLADRGFIPTELEILWKIQGIGITSKLAWRIFIPIFHHRKMVSWTTRKVSNWAGNIPRYMSASLKEESIPHKSLLYGEDYAHNTIIITEGPLDVWRIGPGAVATLGTGYSDDQAFRMTSYPKRVVCFDNEKEAQKRAKKLSDDLSVFPGETFNIQLNAKDAASASVREIKQIRTRFLK